MASEIQKVEAAKIQSGEVQEPVSSVGFTSGTPHSSPGNEAGEQFSDPAISAGDVPAISTFTAIPLSNERILEDQLSLFRNSGELKYEVLYTSRKYLWKFVMYMNA